MSDFLGPKPLTVAAANATYLDKVSAGGIYLKKADDAYRMTRDQITPGADNRDAIQAVINAVAAATGPKKIILPPGLITLGRQLTYPTTAHGLCIEGHGDDTVITQIAGAVNKALFYAGGSDDAKVALAGDLAAGSDVLTIPIAVASTLSTGSLIGLECDTLVNGVGSGNQEGSASEIRRVLTVSGTTIVVAGPLEYNYTVAANAVAYKMNPLRGVELGKMLITSTDASTIKARGIMFEKAQNVRLNQVKVVNAGGGAFLMDTIDAQVTDFQVDSLINYDNPTYLGYGIVAGGRSAYVNIHGLRGKDCRHVFTTLADERTVGGVTTQVGEPRNVTIHGGWGEQKRTGTMYSIWDTHPYGKDIVFDNCHAYGGSGASSNGFQIRNKGTRLINPVAKYSGNQGIRIEPGWAEDVDILGGEIAFAAAGGVGLGKNCRVRGAYIHDNTGAGVLFGDTATGSSITGNRIEDNAYGIHDQSAGGHTGIVIRDNIIPKSVKQTTSILSPKSNLQFTFNSTPGYGVGSDGAGGTVGASVVRRRNDVDGIADPTATQVDFCSTVGSSPAVAALASAASAVIGVANTGIVMPVKPHRNISLAVLEWIAGTTSAGNYDIAVLDSTGARLWSKGSSAWPTASAMVTETVSPAVPLLAGQTYYIVLAADNTTATYKGLNVSSDLLKLVTGVPHSRTVGSIFPVPSSVSLGSTVTGKLPVVMLREA